MVSDSGNRRMTPSLCRHGPRAETRPNLQLGLEQSPDEYLDQCRYDINTPRAAGSVTYLKLAKSTHGTSAPSRFFYAETARQGRLQCTNFALGLWPMWRAGYVPRFH
jgi:hypothetical protein